MNKIYDNLIVGGGPAGALTAYLLAAGGQSVLLLEAGDGSRRKICGEFLCPRGVSLLQEAGLGELALAGTREVRGMRLASPSGIALVAHFPEGAAGRAVNRAQFDAKLSEVAAAFGAEIHLEERVENIRDDGTAWVVTTAKGVYRARVLIGADGRQSMVSRSLKNDLPKNSNRVAVHFHRETNERTGSYGEMHLLPGGAYVGINPTGDHEWNVSLVCDAAFIREHGSAGAALERAFAEIPALASRFLPLSAAGKIGVASPITHSVKRVAGRNWALVGDAAGFLDPLTGEGIYQALLSATMLAGELLALGHSEIWDRSRALARYEAALDARLSAKRRLNRAFQWLIRRPRLCDWVARVLVRDRRRAEVFIGVVGNVYTPIEGIKKLVA